MRRSFVTAAFAAAFLASLATAADAQSRQGNFRGASNHQTSGTVVVDGRNLSLARNFRFDGAPDARLALGSANAVDRATVFAKLKKNSGAQDYRLPGNVNSAGYSHVWLWCERFAVPLGVAPLR